LAGNYDGTRKKNASSETGKPTVCLPCIYAHPGVYKTVSTHNHSMAVYDLYSFAVSGYDSVIPAPFCHQDTKTLIFSFFDFVPSCPCG
jgi:hypothetical protein